MCVAWYGMVPWCGIWLLWYCMVYSAVWYGTWYKVWHAKCMVRYGIMLLWYSMEWCKCILVRLVWVKEVVFIVFYKVAIYTAAIVEQYEDATLVYLKYLVFFIRMPVYLSVFVLLSSLGLCCCLPFFIHMTSVEHYELPFFFLFCCCCWLIQYWSG